MNFAQLKMRPNGDENRAALKDLMTADPSLQVERRHLDGADLLMYRELPASIREWFLRAVEFPDKDFLVFGDDRVTYGEALAQSDIFAAAMQLEFGIEKGDRVAIAMRNYPEWVITFMATAKIGAISVPLNSWWTEEEFAFGLKDSGSKLIVCDRERMERIAPTLTDLDIATVVVRGDGEHIFDELMLKYADRSPAPVAIDGEDNAIIMYTSGSTGFPKGVLSTQRAIVSTMKSWGLSYAAGQLALARKAEKAGVELPAEPPYPPAILLPVPLFHATGSHAGLMMSFLAARKIVMMYKWDIQEALHLIERERVTGIIAVPTQSMELMQAPNLDDFDLSSLTDIGGGGAARPKQHVAGLLNTFQKASVGLGYGLTETNAFGSAIGGPDYAKRPGSTGRAMRPTSEIAIMEEVGGELPTGEVGEVCMRSPSNMRGYWNRPEDTAAVFRDGWLRTGDLGYLDEEEYLYIVDRLKDMIIRGGENISCLEVETCLYQHPDIAEASVFGVPDERLGEVVGTVLFAKNGAALDEAQIVEFVRSHLASFKAPEKIWISAVSLPRTGSEKVDKKTLRQIYLTD